MPRLSANLGFLWRDRPLLEAVGAAAAAGFDAIECHWPYDTDPQALGQRCRQHGLPLLSINTPPGDLSAGDFGLNALPDRVAEARAGIEQAVSYAAASKAHFIHLMAGISATNRESYRTFQQNIDFACRLAARQQIGILIEPINPIDVPGYYLTRTGQAVELIESIDADNLWLMFDCYHVERTEGDTLQRLADCLPRIGHIQIAGVPDRNEPDSGTLDYRNLFQLLQRLDYTGYVGAEYRPTGTTEAGLGWMQSLARQLNGIKNR